MSDLRRRSCEQLSLKLSEWHYLIEMRCGRVVRAWRYCIGRLTADDAQTVMLDCRHSAGWYPLLVLTVDDALEQAHDTLLDHPELPRLIADGCARVADKWECHNDELYTARHWAISLAQGYVADAGLELRLRDEEVDAADNQAP